MDATCSKGERQFSVIGNGRSVDFSSPNCAGFYEEQGSDLCQRKWRDCRNFAVFKSEQYDLLFGGGF